MLLIQCINAFFNDFNFVEILFFEHYCTVYSFYNFYSPSFAQRDAAGEILKQKIWLGIEPRLKEPEQSLIGSRVPLSA